MVTWPKTHCFLLFVTFPRTSQTTCSESLLHFLNRTEVEWGKRNLVALFTAVDWARHAQQCTLHFMSTEQDMPNNVHCTSCQLSKTCPTMHIALHVNWARHAQQCTLHFMSIPRYSCQILMKFKFSRQLSEKSSNIKFHENPSSWSHAVICGRTDGHDSSYSCFLQK
jgi:hypothetical protein